MSRVVPSATDCFSSGSSDQGADHQQSGNVSIASTVSTATSRADVIVRFWDLYELMLFLLIVFRPIIFSFKILIKKYILITAKFCFKTNRTGYNSFGGFSKHFTFICNFISQ